MNFENLKKFDPEVYETLKTELERQRTNIELIASENIVSEAVMEAMGSYFTNKYAEGYPGKRYYGGAAVMCRSSPCIDDGAQGGAVAHHQAGGFDADGVLALQGFQLLVHALARGTQQLGQFFLR